MNTLLDRNTFREECLKRDNHKCVICGLTENLSVHHIIDRVLFKEAEEFGGYFIDNGATLCEQHHLEAEQTILTCDRIRFKCGITNIILPDHLDEDSKYDKWGNMIVTGGRLKGELYYNENVQKIIQCNDFVKYVKYPKTAHFPHSHVSDNTDKILKDDSQFHGKRVIATIKMDGENFTGYDNFSHARSIDSNNHDSRNYAKAVWFQRAHLIDDNMRVCCENIYAKHTIHYNNLQTYLYLISFWIDDICLSWDETLEYAGILNLVTVPKIYDGIYDLNLIHAEFNKYKKESPDLTEGYVVRLADSFKYYDFRKSVAKYVDDEFTQRITKAVRHWNQEKIIPNKLNITDQNF